MFQAIESRTVVPLFVFVALLWLAVVHAQNDNLPDIRQDLQKQNEIYLSRGSSVPKGYVTTRSLVHYNDLLPSRFPDTRDALGTRGRWLDIGAGSGQAIVDFALRSRIEWDDEHRSDVGSPGTELEFAL